MVWRSSTISPSLLELFVIKTTGKASASDVR
jgi:hypothetical protein